MKEYRLLSTNPWSYTGKYDLPSNMPVQDLGFVLNNPYIRFGRPFLIAKVCQTLSYCQGLVDPILLIWFGRSYLIATFPIFQVIVKFQKGNLR